MAGFGVATEGRKRTKLAIELHGPCGELGGRRGSAGCADRAVEEFKAVS